jgi:hypothetical protein
MLCLFSWFIYFGTIQFYTRLKRHTFIIMIQILILSCIGEFQELWIKIPLNFNGLFKNNKGIL